MWQNIHIFCARIFLSFIYEVSFWGGVLTLTLLMWRIWWAPNNASTWQMGFNLAFKGLTKLGYRRRMRNEGVQEWQESRNQIGCRSLIIYRPYPDILLQGLRRCTRCRSHNRPQSFRRRVVVPKLSSPTPGELCKIITVFRG